MIVPNRRSLPPSQDCLLRVPYSCVLEHPQVVFDIEAFAGAIPC